MLCSTGFAVILIIQITTGRSRHKIPRLLPVAYIKTFTIKVYYLSYIRQCNLVSRPKGRGAIPST